jgi:hypothetical protein
MGELLMPGVLAKRELKTRSVRLRKEAKQEWSYRGLYSGDCTKMKNAAKCGGAGYEICDLLIC